MKILFKSTATGQAVFWIIGIAARVIREKVTACPRIA